MYHKVHCFDVSLPERVYSESDAVAAGDAPVVCDTDLGRLGLSVCYDLRFPDLYTRLALAGARVRGAAAAARLHARGSMPACTRQRAVVHAAGCLGARNARVTRGCWGGGGPQALLVPAAFTVPTGMAHWEVLLRARAIENQAFVLAAAQCGRHSPRRETYGHAMIVDPWGTILAQCSHSVRRRARGGAGCSRPGPRFGNAFARAPRAAGHGHRRRGARLRFPGRAPRVHPVPRAPPPRRVRQGPRRVRPTRYTLTPSQVSC